MPWPHPTGAAGGPEGPEQGGETPPATGLGSGLTPRTAPTTQTPHGQGLGFRAREPAATSLEGPQEGPDRQEGGVHSRRDPRQPRASSQAPDTRVCARSSACGRCAPASTRVLGVCVSVL